MKPGKFLRVPIRLQAEDRPRILNHLLRLSPEDRGLRLLQSAAADACIERYVAALDFQRDALYGAQRADGLLICLAHACCFKAAGVSTAMAVLSVDAPYRGLGLGRQLMQQVYDFACENGVARVIGHCFADNSPMRRVFESIGMKLDHHEGIVFASLQLPANPEFELPDDGELLATSVGKGEAKERSLSLNASRARGSDWRNATAQPFALASWAAPRLPGVQGP